MPSRPSLPRTRERKHLDSVPAWVEVATTIGAALAGGAIGAYGAIAGPIYADRRVAKRDQAKATDERNGALRSVAGELSASRATLQLLSKALASKADDIKDSEYNATRATLVSYLAPEDLAGFDDLYARLRQLPKDLNAGVDLAGASERSHSTTGCGWRTGSPRGHAAARPQHGYVCESCSSRFWRRHRTSCPSLRSRWPSSGTPKTSRSWIRYNECDVITITNS